ncbi:hypothetical protein OIU78_022203 [Salix suchowensis]|nr:hypothetical protein OIU78_022203 [Salix suchowensis]
MSPIINGKIPGSHPIGVCYGLNGDNLPSPSEVVGLYKSSGIEFLTLYEPRSDVLEALRGSGLLLLYVLKMKTWQPLLKGQMRPMPIGLANVTITTVIPGNALESSFPPSAGAFSSDISDVMVSVAGILATSDAPLMINVYPYFAYASDPSQVPANYALFTATDPVVTDGSFLYFNLT